MVRINGEEKAYAGRNLLEILMEEGYQLERVVVELNLDILPKEQLETVILKEDDTVEVLRFVGGG